jgi:hypothetical protein
MKNDIVITGSQGECYFTPQNNADDDADSVCRIRRLPNS